MYKTLMVPLDGFTTAEDALPVAARMAERCKARLHIVHVVDLMTRPVYGAAVPSHEWWSGGASRHAAEYVRGVIERVKSDYDVRVTHTLLDPPIAAVLMQEAERVKADLLIMTTHGRSAFGRVWMGSVADQIAREYERPVLFLVSNEKTGVYPVPREFRKILVALDGSRLAEQILPHARALAEVDRGTLTLFHVAKPHWTPVSVLPFVYAADVVPEATVETDFAEAAQHYLHDVAAQTKDEPPLTVVEVSDAPVALSILDQAARERADAIALTTHGHGGVRRLLLGSVADKIVRAAEVPVLLYRPAVESVGV